MYCFRECCFRPRSPVREMIAHVEGMHGVFAPLKRAWSSDLCDTTGCCDIILCLPCQASRQMMAQQGRADKFSWIWCCYFFVAGLQRGKAPDGKIEGGSEGCGGGGCCGTGLTYSPPCWVAALMTRPFTVRMNNIDEGCCTTCCYTTFCPCCSLAQTYREHTAVGVWPGGTMFNTTVPIRYQQQLLMTPAGQAYLPKVVAPMMVVAAPVMVAAVAVPLQ